MTPGFKLRQRNYYEVLRCIDLAIPFPIIFELRFDGKVKPIAAFKRPNEADASKWVISEYFNGGWIKEVGYPAKCCDFDM